MKTNIKIAIGIAGLITSFSCLPAALAMGFYSYATSGIVWQLWFKVCASVCPIFGIVPG
jgi:hypothetical protein